MTSEMSNYAYIRRKLHHSLYFLGRPIHHPLQHSGVEALDNVGPSNRRPTDESAQRARQGIHQRLQQMVNVQLRVSPTPQKARPGYGQPEGD